MTSVTDPYQAGVNSVLDTLRPSDVPAYMDQGMSPAPNYILGNKMPGSMGVNIPQVIVAGLENAVASKGNMKNSLLIAGSVGISNLLPAYGPAGMWGSNAEKYLAEPLIAGVLYALGTKFITASGAAEGSSAFKKVAKGFIIGASSAAVSGALISTTLAPVRIQSQYSGGARGLRGQSNLTSGYKGPLVVS